MQTGLVPGQPYRYRLWSESAADDPPVEIVFSPPAVLDWFPDNLPVRGSQNRELGGGQTHGRRGIPAGIRALYLLMRDEALYDECAGPEQGQCCVTAAFVAGADPEAAALAEPVITRWYYGQR